MSLVTTNKPIWQLVVSFLIGAGISVVTAIVFGTPNSIVIVGYLVPVSLIGLGVSIIISVVLGIWAGRIRSNRLWGSVGHVILYSVFTFQLQSLIF